jgi:hypothetical protein
VNAEELGAQRASVRERSRWKEKSRTSARRAVLKKADLTPHLRRWACRVSETFARARARPGETATHNHDASFRGLAESMRSHDGAVTSVTSAEMPAPITAPTSPRRPKLPRRNVPKLQRLQLQIKARERVSNSLTSSGATTGGCARTHPPRT